MYIQSRFLVSKGDLQNLLISGFLTFFAVMVCVVGLTYSASANGAGDTFLWKKSYGRGAGAIPTMTTECAQSRDKVGALCYDKCKQGFGVNPKNKLRCSPPGAATYDRGSGIAPTTETKCTNSRDKVGALCYDKCKPGFGVNPKNNLMCKPPGAATYDRGAGKFPKKKGRCEGGYEHHKKLDLCYKIPKPGYSCSGIVCKRNIKAYQRQPFKTETLTYCKSNRNLESGMCYNKPKDGYSCSVTICSRIIKGYDRKSHPLKSFCKDDKVLTEGLCYKKCRNDFKGVGPVCWSELPDQWINCGVGGMATGMQFPKFLQGKKFKGLSAKTNCGVITGGQAAATVAFASAACAVAGNPGCAVFDDAEEIGREAMYRDDSDDFLVQGEAILNDLTEGYESLAKYLTSCGDSCSAVDTAAPLMDKIRVGWKNLTALQKIMIVKQGASGSNNLLNISRTTYKLSSEPPEKGLPPSETLATIREVAAVLQVVIALLTFAKKDLDPATKEALNFTSASLGMISAFAFPIQGQN